MTAVALLAGCGAQSDPAPATGAQAAAKKAAAEAAPALCRTRLRARVTGHIADPFASELSGLVVSPTRPGVLWALNDSGDSARLLAVTTAGETVAEVAVSGAQNVDWEDIERGPGGSLLAGDIGDNDERRASIVVYRIPEQLTSGTVAAEARYELRYPDGAHDAEALLFDRSNGSIVVVTKSWAGVSRVYVARRPSSRRMTTLRRVGGRIDLGFGGAVTAGDVSADGRTIALRTYDGAYVWRRRPKEAVATALGRKPCSPKADLIPEGQGESLALTRDGRAFYTVPEGDGPALRRYE